jgi:putative GTP pyrophosphokinase
MDIIDKFLNENFVIINSEYKQENLDFNKLDYVSNHYDTKINCQIKDFSHLEDLKEYIFEIQVRTLNQHAWSNTAHSLSYKQEAELPIKLKRKVYRLLSLYELADDEFSSVNEKLKQQFQSPPAYALLRKLEGKSYKYAKFDYDREISLKVINTILNYFETVEEKNILIDNIDGFINDNEQKIKRIYEENRSRYHEILFLTQPEIFIIWYMLQNNTFTIEDNWECDFGSEDIEQIKTLWGNEI